MAWRTWIAAAVGAALIAACDVSQKTPQTSPPAASAPGGLIRGGTVSVGSESTGEYESRPVAGEKSIRLQGPGVNRARQIRV
jgi:hypothetical protein